ncbi:EAL domain-containing protein (plasmid) [Paraburkholderia sp. D15]|uniref:EAL domain-containing protein n=1 Tax=Paraburkholderia sp. D15 TaxID=2880218 RepID=UPI002479DC91|nr:EAL domain-containing protein [Paraburkholderia sp. D15]WGS55164.1 EAL domain-containing protein [Paraburkholderia sp. D15]
MLDDVAGVAVGPGGERFVSAFQAIYDLARQKPVGFEALLREPCGFQQWKLPAEIMRTIGQRDPIALDVKSHATHLANAGPVLGPDEWLFLNSYASTIAQPGYAISLARQATGAGIAPHRIVLEILETEDGSLEELADHVDAYKSAGFLIALDDFGVGYSNLCRLLRLKPDLIKLDRSLLPASPDDYRLLVNLVRLMHEAGIFVVAEGIETAEQLVAAVHANVDFVQGFLFGRPHPQNIRNASARALIDTAFDEARVLRADLTVPEHYRRGLKRVKQQLLLNLPLAESCAPLTGFGDCIGCFLLDETGRQVGDTIQGPAFHAAAPKFSPLCALPGARWDNRDYFREAIERPGNIAIEGPWRAVNGAQLCVTVATAVRIEGRCFVLGADICWR